MPVTLANTSIIPLIPDYHGMLKGVTINMGIDRRLDIWSLFPACEYYFVVSRLNVATKIIYRFSHKGWDCEDDQKL